LLLALGEFGDNQFTAPRRKALVPAVESYYRNDPDPGVHAAAEWLLRQWKQEKLIDNLKDQWIDDFKLRQGAIAASRKPGASLGWFMNRQKQTMVLVPGPVEFRMGEPPPGDGYKCRIDRSFAISSTHVTVEQYKKFQKEHQGGDQEPAVNVNWHDAAAYCNWLSEQEGIAMDQWCFEINAAKEARLKENYLKLKGYRLPTSAEMEYATRAGSTTSYSFGEDQVLLEKYGFYSVNSKNRIWPVGMLKPNDLGLVDAHGNAFSWCTDFYGDYPQGDATISDIGGPNRGSVRVIRGGCWNSVAVICRSALRIRDDPSYRLSDLGFRLALSSSGIPQ
jgi:formylglycine-generating enzyme required for sulfatase activity